MGQDAGEVRTELVDRSIEEISDRCRRGKPFLCARGLPSLGKETESGHVLRVAGADRSPTVAGVTSRPI